MASRGSESWWFQHWGKPCLRDGQATAVVRIGGHPFKVDARAKTAFEALDRVFRRNNVTVNPPYPQGDSGTGNCRHIANDPNRPWSSHAWWAALDRNWKTNPDGSRLVTDLPRKVIDEVHALHTKSGARVFRWGGDWDRDPRTSHSYYDAMHFEVHATPTELQGGVFDPHGKAEEWSDMASKEEIEAAVYDGTLKALTDWGKGEHPTGWGRLKVLATRTENIEAAMGDLHPEVLDLLHELIERTDEDEDQ